MARRINRKAVLASIRSRKTPAPLKKGLRKYARRRGWL
jgi:hypothetical protein